MKGKLIRTVFLPGLLIAALAVPAFGDGIHISVTNLTTGTYFTPLIIAAHDGDNSIFTAGEPASSSVEILAECGDFTGVLADMNAAGADTLVNPAEGPLAPGATATGKLMTSRGNKYLSLAAMLIPTNDGFVGLDSLPIPRATGTYIYYLYGYDAGTEVNDEVLFTEGCDASTPGIPGDPTGLAGTGGTGVASVEPNMTVHVHPGVVGDLDPAGGASDLSSAYHDWVNPVAKLVITVHRWSHGGGGWGNK
ncbi:MAG: spondin domain-containing protein [Pseudomonadota bacterium]